MTYLCICSTHIHFTISGALTAVSGTQSCTGELFTDYEQYIEAIFQYQVSFSSEAEIASTNQAYQSGTPIEAYQCLDQSSHAAKKFLACKNFH